MAFNSSLYTSEENCDKCKNPMNKEQPGMRIMASSGRYDNHIILIHINCMQKLITRAWKEANSKAEVEVQCDE